MNTKLALTCAFSIVAALTAVSADTLMAQSRSMGLLDRLSTGRWELRLRDAAAAPQHLCLGDARQLIQLRHPGQNCSRIVVEDTPSQIVVQYTCPGHGYGRTLIRRESDSLVQLDTQGIAQGLPFAYAAEARRVGACRS